jgi:hypothetical protein
MYRNGPFRSVLPPEELERQHRNKFAEDQEYDEWIERRDRHADEGIYSEKHSDAPVSDQEAA